MTASGITAEELRDSIREVLEGETLSAAATAETTHRTARATELWHKMGGLGWFGLTIEERFGGLGLGFRELGVLYEELGRYLTPFPVLPTLLVAECLGLAGSEDQKSRWLPALAAGELRATLALPTGTANLPALDASGTARGSVANVLYADSVDELLLPVRDGAGRTYLAVIAHGAADVRIDARPVIDRSRSLADVELSGARVTPDRLLLLDERLWTALLDHACVSLACDAVGGAARILELTVGYMGTRTQFGRTIGSFQALKHRAATWKVLAEAVTALARHSADLLASGDSAASAAASSAKFSACDAYVAVAGDAIQLHGGIGFTWAHECHRFLKRARLDAVLFGGSMQHRDRVAEFAFGSSLGTSSAPRRLLASVDVPPRSLGGAIPWRPRDA